MTWLRSLFGIGTGALNLLANGHNWKQVLLSAGVAGLGVVSHLTSTSGKTDSTANPSVQHIGPMHSR